MKSDRQPLEEQGVHRALISTSWRQKTQRQMKSMEELKKVLSSWLKNIPADSLF